jgi:hypothetical protein
MTTYRTVYRVWHADVYISEYTTLREAESADLIEGGICATYSGEECGMGFIQTVAIDDNGDEWEVL